MANEFSVCQFFADDMGHEYVRRFVSADEAAAAARHYTTSVGARLGMTTRVIITDGLDCVCWEWTFGEGITFPRLEAPMAKHWCEWKDWRFWGKNRVVPYVWVQRTGVCRVCGHKLHGHWLFNRQKAAVGFY